ncbi:MAG: glycosyltransferase family 2 protein [Dehalococcoidia bacterium]|nr:glycosyltransferase family 2 protein [Dehalococcoidia bacterium]
MIIKSHPKVSIIISSFNAEHLLPECLDSLGALTYPDYEVIIVDAASTDNSRSLMAERYPWVRVIPLENKVGIGEAINHGIGAAEGDIIIIEFNTDETAEPDWLDHLVAALQQYPDEKVMLGGARLVYGTDRLVDDLGMKFYHPFGVATKYYQGLPLDSCPKDQIREVSYLNMIAAWRHTYDELGPLNESFFFFGEDMEYCLRARRKGYRTLIAPKAITWHKVSATIGKYPERQAYFLRRSMLYSVLKHYPWRFKPFAVLGYAMICGLDILMLLPSMDRLLARTRFPMFSRRRTAREVWADARAVWWNVSQLPQIVSSHP